MRSTRGRAMTEGAVGEGAGHVPAGAPLLAVEDLDVRFAMRDGEIHAVRGLSFTMAPGDVLGLVGESGSGKSQVALALLGLLADNGRAAGRASFEGHDLLAMPDAERARLRGSRLAMVFQDPMTALNPYLTIGTQMSLVLRRHRGLGRAAALAECARLLDAVHIGAPRRRLAQYPHELSGGMRQRVMIASALLCRPALLIADEPTTALDVTVQAQIVTLMLALRREFNTAILFITHDLGLVAGTCERVLVMHRGACLEQGPVTDLYAAPRSAGTRALLAAVPRLDAPCPPRPPVDGTPLLAVEGLSVDYRATSPGGSPHAHRAVDDASFVIAPGETLGLVGESGSGKSTLARAVLRLIAPATGRICVLGRDLAVLDGEALRHARRPLQLVFQDPLASLDPRMTVRDIVAEPLTVFEPGLARAGRDARVVEALAQVGLEAAAMNRYPHQFSGGQCQRIGIARALITQPALVICDEPVSALDVTVQAGIIALLDELQRTLGLAILFIAHDLAVVRRISHRVMVMYHGRIVEVADSEALYERPRHPYTRALLDAVPIPDPVRERARQYRRAALGVDDIAVLPANGGGCAYRGRCAWADTRCAEAPPPLRAVGESQVACHHAEAHWP